MVLPITPRIEHVMKLTTSGMIRNNVNWINNTDLDGTVFSPTDRLVRLNILPVMLTSETLFSTDPAQTHNAINIKAIHFMTRSKNEPCSVSSPPLGRPRTREA